MVELAALEKRYGATHRGFESLSLRQEKFFIVKPTILALRAVTSTFFRRIFVPLAWFLMILALIAWIGVIYLAVFVHGAWWFALLVLVPGSLVLGLFLFVINALMFWAAAGVLDGFHVDGFGAALLGSLLYSVLGLAVDSALERLFPRQ